MRAAAAITSITMNGGTLLRAEGVSSARAESIIIAVPPGHSGWQFRLRPAVAAFDRSLEHDHERIRTRPADRGPFAGRNQT
jgi:hypothetical protein